MSQTLNMTGTQFAAASKFENEDDDADSDILQGLGADGQSKL